MATAELVNVCQRILPSGGRENGRVASAKVVVAIPPWPGAGKCLQTQTIASLPGASIFTAPYQEDRHPFGIPRDEVGD